MSDTDFALGALGGVKVLDLSRVLGGPYATQILGDHGADVLKVEPPQGDETRAWGPPFEGGTSSYYRGVNRNKRGTCLDLREESGRRTLFALLAAADVLVENFKPGTLEAWGIGNAALAARFPRLIHCCISGFGADGPMGGMPGYDAAVQAMAGLMSVNGDADGGPMRLGVPVVDMVSGLNAVIGILLALQERTRSGKGQYVDVALFDSALSILHPHSANFLGSGNVPQRTGNAHPNISPYNMFETASGLMFLSVGNNGQFRKLCALLKAPHLCGDPRYATNRDRSLHREALRVDLERLFANHDAVSLAERLVRAGVPCGPALTVDQALAHPHTHHRNMVLRQGDYAGIASPIKLSRTPPRLRRLPPGFGEHDAEVHQGIWLHEDAR